MSGHRRAGPTGPGFGGDGFDAEEIFNMFFNGGFGGGARCVKTSTDAFTRSLTHLLAHSLNSCPSMPRSLFRSSIHSFV